MWPVGLLSFLPDYERLKDSNNLINQSRSLLLFRCTQKKLLTNNVLKNEFFILCAKFLLNRQTCICFEQTYSLSQIYPPWKKWMPLSESGVIHQGLIRQLVLLYGCFLADGLCTFLISQRINATVWKNPITAASPIQPGFSWNSSSTP